jgi:hypothetical protein
MELGMDLELDNVRLADSDNEGEGERDNLDDSLN